MNKNFSNHDHYLLKLIIFTLIFVCDCECSSNYNYVTLPSSYSVIGPFPIGEREEGVDSMQYYTKVAGGGANSIFDLPRDSSVSYPSELGNEGRVRWLEYTASSSGSPLPYNNSSSSLSIDYNDIPWQFLESQLSWSVYMWYGYAVGQLGVDQSSPTDKFIIYCTNVLRYYIIDNNNNSNVYEFIGDLYNYGVAQQVVTLVPGGNYTVWIRLQSSVRQFLSPHAAFNLTILPFLQREDEQQQPPFIIVETDSLMSSVVDGWLASTYGSITLLNVGDSPLPLSNLKLYNSKLEIDIINNNNSSSSSSSIISILPGQRYSLSFSINQIDDELECSTITNKSILEISVIYESSSSSAILWWTAFFYFLGLRSNCTVCGCVSTFYAVWDWSPAL
ncbi:hypothetical protein PPL_05335 [Heterostelium album PN500]|uniref:Uncharacterized protein n=1 Tax=Heterostelium pallidum (strain ATCC 26659 / Pp 5 / PN500) TaxID=670386 RepID=D3B9W5_HETP5|nr:hypothetical protein PPL_05335 [Heterostelium album PN500]EFA81352.1 hypothetical protein PPL_05335 [Heterostelium album PN500]|eukprot:XP_020433470.1 hypothetical protein PPL_05335 [Heterostelium album PN500]